MISGADGEGEDRGLGGARPGGARHQGPRGWRRAWTGRDDRCEQQARSTARGSNRGHSTRSARVSRVPDGRSAGIGVTTARAGSCDDAADGRTSLGSVRVAAARRRRLAAVAGALARPGRSPTARSRPSRRRRLAAPRLDVRAAADARHRRRDRLVAVGGPPGRRGPPGATPSRAGGRSRSSPGCSRSRSRCCRGSSATTRPCSRSTWSSTCC